MARSSWHDHNRPDDTRPDGTGREGTGHDQPARPDDDTVGAATRAIADATAALTKLLGNQLASVSTELGDAIATSLRDAARGLADASETVERRSGGQRADERRRARVDRTRADLLAAAGRVFAAQGYEGASVGDIAAEAGYTKGALYAHFGSKSDLFVALARERLDCDRSTGPAAGPATGDLADELSAGIAATGDDPSMLLALEMLAYAVRHPEARDDLGPLFDTSLQALAERVRDDRLARSRSAGSEPDPTAGVTRDDLDTALGLLAVTNVSAMLAAITDDPRTVAAAGGRLVDRLLTR
ncbi:MAG TPA: helix-turn-helix domain-containing protein [Cellulomonas sp.]|uniref:TetR/AcrR family transcriptional regulator n=1 Tax=Cellulomonas sp. TaxID=40001 RepID=UPI002E30276D|nr:helix-turn-helix domain-containing protein [Cellulomonas sp.]HEX5332940.1 helix-turn-helix domain-containing protein [Cellulomonas sp.]